MFVCQSVYSSPLLRFDRKYTFLVLTHSLKLWERFSSDFFLHLVTSGQTTGDYRLKGLKMAKKLAIFFLTYLFRITFKWFSGLKKMVFSHFNSFGCFGGFNGIISGKIGKNVFFPLPNFLQMTFKWFIRVIYIVFDSLYVDGWLSAWSPSTLIKPQAIRILNFTWANGR